MVAERTTVPFIDSLRASGLLSDAQLAELAKCPEARDPAPTPLARVILQRGWLTRFQLNMIAAGSAKGLTVGPYTILDRIGEGGMGMIYKARHQHMQRLVALKVIRKEKLASADAVKRFYQEVQMAGTLQHPNIVLAYDAGQAGNTHYFAMEYVDGVDLSNLVKEKGRLPVAQACDCLRQIALGLQHAHEKGLVHRDVKPSNMLLSRGAKGDVVKLLDMGLARSQSGGDTGLTKIGAVIGTPDYLAPEQAMNSKAADIRADLYSLGCSLYYLLTAKPPFTAGELTEVLLKHQMEKPTPLAQLGVDVPKQVQAILDRLLAKRPDERYQTPTELIEDLEPFCGTPTNVGSIKVRKDQPADDSSTLLLDNDDEKEAPNRSAVVRPTRRKAAADSRKKRLLLIGIGGGAALLLLALLLFLLLRNDKPDAVTQGPKSSEPEKAASGKEKSSTNKGGNPDGGKPHNDKNDPPPAAGLLALPPGEFIQAAAFSPDGRRAVLGGTKLRLWDLAGNKPIHDFGGVRYSRIDAIVWSPRDNRVLVGGLVSRDGKSQGEAALYEADTGKLLTTFRGHPTGIHAVALSADGSRVLTAAGNGRVENGKAVLNKDGKFEYEDTGVRLWDAATGQELGAYFGPSAPIRAVAFAADGKSIIALGGFEDPHGFVWEVQSKNQRQFTYPVRTVDKPILAPDGREAVFAGDDHTFHFLDTANGTEVRRSDPLPRRPTGTVWSRDGRFLACGSVLKAGEPAKDSILLLTAKDGKIVHTFAGHEISILMSAISDDGRLILTSSTDGTRLWSVDKPPPEKPIPDKPPVQEEGPFVGHTGDITSVAFCDGGKLLVSSGVDATVRVWDVASGKKVNAQLFGGPINCLEVTAGGGHDAWVAFADGWLVLMHVAPFTGHQRIDEAAPKAGSTTLYAIASSPDGRYVARAGKNVRPGDNDDPKRGKIYLSIPADAHSVAFSSDNKWLAYGADDGTIHVFDVSGAKPEEKMPIKNAHKGSIPGLAFVPKTTQVISGGDDGFVVAWDVTTGKEVRRYAGVNGHVTAVAVSPDGKQVTVGDSDGVVYLWDLAESAEKKRISEHKSPVRRLAYAPDGKTLASCSRDGIKLWPVEPSESKPPPVVFDPAQKMKSVVTKNGFKGHDAEVLSVSYSADGTKVLSSDTKGGLFVWEARTGKFVKSKPITTPHPMNISRLVGDGTHVVVVMDRRSIQTFVFDTNKTVLGISFDARSAWAASHNGEMLLYAEDRGGVRVAGSLKGTGRDFTFVDKGWGTATAAAFAPDDERFACATADDGMIHIGDPKMKKEVGKPFRGPGDVVTCLALAPKAAYVLTTEGNTLTLWDPATGKEVRKFVGPTGKVLCLAFSPDGKYAVSGHDDGMVCYWEVETGREVKRGTEHKSAVRGVAFSPDGRHIASCGDGIKLWDVQKP